MSNLTIELGFKKIKDKLDEINDLMLEMYISYRIIQDTEVAKNEVKKLRENPEFIKNQEKYENLADDFEPSQNRAKTNSEGKDGNK